MHCIFNLRDSDEIINPGALDRFTVEKDTSLLREVWSVKGYAPNCTRSTSKSLVKTGARSQLCRLSVQPFIDARLMPINNDSIEIMIFIPRS